MDTLLLEAFVKVAETESFSVAAESLHLTQSAVSKRIALLEQQLNCKLFDRIARTVSLTQAGRELLPRAHSILAELSLTRQVIADLSGSVRGRLRLAISHHIGLRRLPPVLKQYMALYPEVAVSATFMDSERACQGVLQGTQELAVITLSEEKPAKIVTKTIWPDPMSFVAAPEHPLATAEKTALAELQNYPAVLPELNTYTGSMVRELFRNQGLTLHTAMTTNYLETIRAMVSTGLGWSVLPVHMIDQDLHVIDVPTVNLTRNLGYMHHREKTLSNAARAFIDMLHQEKIQ